MKLSATIIVLFALSILHNKLCYASDSAPPPQTCDSEACQAFTVPDPGEGIIFFSSFQELPIGLVENSEGGWVVTKNADYATTEIRVQADGGPGLFSNDKGLVLEKEARKYGISAEFPAVIENNGKELVIQYELKLKNSLDCGGAYIKILGHDSASPSNLDQLSSDSQYVIMFGPDKCGSTDKVHFIFKHFHPLKKEWEEKHLRVPPKAVLEVGKTHLYTLIVRPDQSFEILINQESVRKGSLLDDFEPPVVPPAEIDDPDDFKPSDWIDEAEIPDPEARKPDDWDENAPMFVPDEDATKPAGWLEHESPTIDDPAASKPEDWDEEEDGEWDAPQIPNPKCDEAPGCGKWKRPTKRNFAYKGKWIAPLVENPQYKGPWVRKTIPNPYFFEDKNPAKLAPMSAVAIEVWTMTGGMRFDNFWIGHSSANAKDYAEKTWRLKRAAETAQVQESRTLRERLIQYREQFIREDGNLSYILARGSEFILWALDNPTAAAILSIFIPLALTIFIYIARSMRSEQSSEDELTEEEEKEDGSEAVDTSDNEKEADFTEGTGDSLRRRIPRVR